MSLPNSLYRAVILDRNRKLNVEIANIPIHDDNQLLIRVVAAALNPTDWKHVKLGWGPNNAVAGSDCSGVVVKVGENLKDIYRVGDQVSSTLHGLSRDTPDNGAFADYCVVDPEFTIKYKQTLSLLSKSSDCVGDIDTFEAAASITLSLVTVGQSLFHFLKGSFEEKTLKDDEYYLVWGGATSFGQIAIQFAKHVFQWNVVAVASKKNEALLKELGADIVIDYHDADAVEQIKAKTNDKVIIATDAIANSHTIQFTHDATSNDETVERIIIDNLNLLGEEKIKNLKKNVQVTKTLMYPLNGKPVQLTEDILIESDASSVEDNKIFMKFAQDYINQGKLKHGPLKLLPKGLGSVSEGLDLLQEKKISCQKLVLKISDTVP
ncbi:zinc-binding alcohol dehydrogenase family protein [Ascoidea rubescens DSM 1968]|uniref:GroES-like protein n=1 Tax=Ascoidea rubescens DSM 1968 TaxID=1344418 RepID=A0A1D2VQW4_9ASCO|nr:GroES-like protein [Ascoidea rubescens DSM 1968]ODV63955.1 GroES-like protein [Ascoidea rubescens DSM 1968]